jgi:signal transduction histidine kinase
MSSNLASGILGILFLGMVAPPLAGRPAAEKGILDLREHDFSKEGIVEVAGEWSFYWNRLIDPDADTVTGGVFVPVPAEWKKLKTLVPGIASKGYGSYNLKILLPGHMESVALRFTDVFSASGYYINGIHLGYNGLPGSNQYQSVFGYSPSLFVVAVNDTLLDLVVHVSNFEHRSGGICGKVELGTPVQIISGKAGRQLGDYFLMGAFLIIGVYFLALFQSRSDLYMLFFALICLVMVFRIYVLSDTDFQLFKWITGISRLRLEYLSFYLLVPLFVLMVRFLFPNDFPRALFKLILSVCVVMIVVVIFTPVSLFTGVFPFYMYFVIFSGGVVVYTIITAWLRGRHYAQGFAVGIVVVVAGALNDMLFVADVVETGLVSHYTMFVFLMIYAVIFSRKIHRDMLRNEQLSDEIMEVNQNLESLVDKRTRELREKSEQLIIHREELRRNNEELQREVSIRNRFIAILGHDIKGPVGYANQVLELILGGTLSKEDEKEMLKLTADSSRTLLNLLENLLYWGRCQTRELKSMAEAFVPEKIVEEAAELYKLPIREKGIVLSVDMPEKAKVFADKEQVKLIIRNLMANAIKFTDSAGEIRINGAVDASKGEFVFEVADSGTGIEKTELDRIFTGPIVTPGTRKEKGSGFGLKLCKELVELNGGSISAESQPGVGSRFFVRLPLANKSVQ